MALHIHTNAAAVCNGAFIRVVPASQDAEQEYSAQRAALALCPVENVYDAAAIQNDTRLSMLEPELPLLPIQSGRLLANDTLTSLLCVAPNDVLLLRPPSISHVLYSALSCPSTSYSIVGESHSSYLASQPIDARWHPLSDQHFVVLSTDGVRLFDAGLSVSVAVDEWLFPTAITSKNRPVACSFGNAHEWEAFTLFILFEDASIYYINPVVPFGALFSKADWHALHQSMRSVRDLPAHQVDNTAFEAAGLTLAWLEHSFVDVDAQWKRYLPRDSGSRFGRGVGRGGVRFDIAKDTLYACLQGPVEIFPKLTASNACDLATLTAKEVPALAVLLADGRMVSVVGTAPVFPSWGSPVIGISGPQMPSVPAGTPLEGRIEKAGGGQGAVAGYTPMESKAGGALDPLCFAVTAAIDLRLSTPVKVASDALDGNGATYPGGATGAGYQERGAGYAILRKDSAPAKDLLLSPRILPDTITPGVLYVISRGAVHLVKFNWLTEASSLKASDMGRSSKSIPYSVYCMYEGEMDICGAALAKIPKLGARTTAESMILWTIGRHKRVSVGPSAAGLRHKFLVAGQVETCAVLPTILAADLAATPMSAATEQATPEGENVFASFLRSPAFHDVYAPYTDLLSRVQAGFIFKDPKNKESIAYLAECSEGVAEIVSHLNNLRAHTNLRAKTLHTVAVDAAARVRESKAAIGSLHEDATRSHQRLERLAAGGENLRARAEAITFALSLLRSRLSKAELAYHREMDTYKSELSDYLRPRVADLQAVSSSLAAEGRVAGHATVDISDVGGVLGLGASRSTNTVNSTQLAELKQSEAEVKQEVALCQTALSELQMVVEATQKGDE